MLKEFVEAISGLAVHAAEAQILRNPFDPRKAFLLHHGAVNEMQVAPPLWNAFAETFADLFTVIEEFGSDNPSIWHDEDGVVALLNNSDRLERVQLKLQKSDQFRALNSVLPKAFDQRGLILFLKRNLAGAVDDTVITAFRKLDFSKREEGSSVIRHGEESLGRGIHGKVTGESEIPEFLTVTVSVYTNPDAYFPVNIRLSVDIDVQRSMIELSVLPDELTRASTATQGEINRRLIERDNDATDRGVQASPVTIIRGTPTFACTVS